MMKNIPLITTVLSLLSFATYSPAVTVNSFNVDATSVMVDANWSLGHIPTINETASFNSANTQDTFSITSDLQWGGLKTEGGWGPSQLVLGTDDSDTLSLGGAADASNNVLAANKHIILNLNVNFVSNLAVSGLNRNVIFNNPVTILNSSTLTLTSRNNANPTFNSTFSGNGSVVVDPAINNGPIYFNGAVSYTGSTSILGGTLELGSGVSLASSSSLTLGYELNVNVDSEGVLDTDANASYSLLSAQPITFNLTGEDTGRTGSILAQELNITDGDVSFSIVGTTLDDDAYILANYTSLVGSAFGSVSDLPEGYGLDYNYLGGNQIALVAVPEPAQLGLIAGLVGFLVAVVRRRRQLAS